MVVGVSSVAASEQQYTYRVDHSVYGEIGTYRNNVQVSGNDTAIDTEADIRISLLGIILYRQHASRIERWTGDRLVYFHGVTVENGKTTQIEGRAEADRFIVSSPTGSAIAPATIRVANPGSAGTLSGDTILMPDTGFITTMRVNRGEEVSIAIDSKLDRVRLYEIETGIGQRYDIWVDEEGVPVKFDMKDNLSTVTFTLVR